MLHSFSAKFPSERRYATWDRRNYQLLIEYNAIPKLVLTGTYRSTERAEQHQKRIDRKISWFEKLIGTIDNRFTQVGEAVADVTRSETLSYERIRHQLPRGTQVIHLRFPRSVPSRTVSVRRRLIETHCAGPLNPLHCHGDLESWRDFDELVHGRHSFRQPKTLPHLYLSFTVTTRAAIGWVTSTQLLIDHLAGFPL